MKIAFDPPKTFAPDILVMPVWDKGKLGKDALELDANLDGALARVIKVRGFKGAAEQSVTLLAPVSAGPAQLALIGFGDPAKLDAPTVVRIGGALASAIGDIARTAHIMIDTPTNCPVSSSDMAANLALGLRLGTFRFDRYRTVKNKNKPFKLKQAVITCDDPTAAANTDVRLAAVADGVELARTLGFEPANKLGPVEFVRCIEDELTPLGIEIEVLDEKAMKKSGFGALLGVAQGSAKPPRLVVMRLPGAKSKSRPLALVGKGVMFDSGGISLKPGAKMWDMKYDMCGAAAVVGAMRALALRKSRADVVGVVALVENMPSGTAQRPGDIVTSLSGQTIEVLNTDAEGRLILADALYYTWLRFDPRAMIDIATLTGAVVVALGSHYAGLMANDDDLADKLFAASKASGERLWRMPLDPDYDKQMDSDVADMANIDSGGRAGTITAGQFLQRFVGKCAWAHVDIAGTAWTDKPGPLGPKGATGVGVRLFEQIVFDMFEG
ncbi:MAG: leucyl aminopeptidase [Pseudomonadota bacterium]|nr:leucyl aminopeptidase [Pseudomonadota bacterium]